MNKFITVHAYGEETIVNISHIKRVVKGDYGKAVIYHSDGKWIELEESYEYMKQRILEVTS